MKCLVLQLDVSNNKSVIVKPLNEIQPINPFKPKPELSRFIEDFIGYYNAQFLYMALSTPDLTVTLRSTWPPSRN